MLSISLLNVPPLSSIGFIRDYRRLVQDLGITRSDTIKNLAIRGKLLWKLHMLGTNLECLQHFCCNLKVTHLLITSIFHKPFAVFHYSQLQFSIPFHHFQETDTQSKLENNWVFKIITSFQSAEILDLYLGIFHSVLFCRGVSSSGLKA
ncbi:hypothetical protein L1987_48925 [Smallanthus sonchifolius]|uniref:Uncharacterized protein n=1 Tax=Smallanthus sonchifolius TaxID=185202 RepID=A0ACB9FUX8_9ASTR|nr:hypothetical protein L1987_48925 [Smallanthus sonchifolius]